MVNSKHILHSPIADMFVDIYGVWICKVRGVEKHGKKVRNGGCQELPN